MYPVELTHNQSSIELMCLTRLAIAQSSKRTAQVKSAVVCLIKSSTLICTPQYLKASVGFSL